MSDDVLALYADAAFYDLEFARRLHELPFLERWAARLPAPLLEVACGTGRLTLPFARRGVDITGIDLSLPMLERARDHARAEGLAVTFLQQDCRALSLDRRFGFIFCATNAMQHLTGRGDALRFLRAARDHLRPGGLLLIDVFNPDLRKLTRPADQVYEFKRLRDDAGDELVVYASSHYADDSQLLHFTLSYRKGDITVKEKRVTMRCFFPEELWALVDAAGLTVRHRFGDYLETPFAAGAPKQLLLCGL